MVSERFTVAVCAGLPESVTLNVSAAAFTAAEGVPLIRPLAEFSVNPAGRVPLVNCHVKAPVPPAAATVCEYAKPTWPLAREFVVIVRTAGTIVRLRLAIAFCAVARFLP